MPLSSVLDFIPSPSTNGVSIGPVRLHVYGLLIAVAVLVAVRVAQTQWTRIGGAPATMSALAVWGVPGGLVGARVYSLITSWNADTGGHVVRAFEIWRGGLGIWGGLLGGVATGLWGAHRHGLPFRPLLDCVAPAFPLAQAVGRFGNYFNQELYGRRTGLPWGLDITGLPGHYQPTFAYEAIWDVACFFIVIGVRRRFRIRRGYLLAVYAAAYTFGRFFTEYLRIDEAHRFWGLRLNDWTSIVVFTLATVLVLLRGRAGPGDDRAGDPLPVPTGVAAGGVAPGDGGPGGADAGGTDAGGAHGGVAEGGAPLAGPASTVPGTVDAAGPVTGAPGPNEPG